MFSIKYEKRLILILVSFLLTVLGTSSLIEPISAAAQVTGNAQRLRDVNAPDTFRIGIWAVPTDGEMRIEVVNPSANANPVLHVQTTGSATFVASTMTVLRVCPHQAHASLCPPL